MTSLYSVNYHTRAHKRDAFIEFIKSLLLTPFVLHSRPHSEAAPQNQDSNFMPREEEADRRVNFARYAEILGCVEELVKDHILHQSNGLAGLSRLSTLVPSIGHFFTPLPIRDGFMRQDTKRSIAARRFVPPSFNDVRAILNDAQLTAIAPQLKLITFDGDMTLYADGADFAADSHLVKLIIQLLRHGLYVALVTAAGYPKDAAKYEQRLQGLLAGFRSSQLPPADLSRFYVMGGECNYLFQYDAHVHHLVYLEPAKYEPESVRAWSLDDARIGELLDLTVETLRERVEDMGLADKAVVLRKARAAGVIAAKDVRLTREQLDELALSVQRRLNNFQHARRVQTGQTALPFCAFNGGSDVWVDIGNKLIGVNILQEYLGTTGAETLHVGDQFLSTGNDIATRTACCTSWITSPEETAEILTELCSLLDAQDAAKVAANK